MADTLIAAAAGSSAWPATSFKVNHSLSPARSPRAAIDMQIEVTSMRARPTKTVYSKSESDQPVTASLVRFSTPQFLLCVASRPNCIVTRSPFKRRPLLTRCVFGVEALQIFCRTRATFFYHIFIRFDLFSFRIPPAAVTKFLVHFSACHHVQYMYITEIKSLCGVVWRFTGLLTNLYGLFSVETGKPIRFYEATTSAKEED